MQQARFSARTDRPLILDAGGSRRFVLVSLDAPPAPKGPRPPLHLGLALDRSGSMNDGDRIVLARKAAVAAIRSLVDTDRFSVVAYNGEAEVIVPATLASPAAREQAIGKILNINAEAGTDLFAGWLKVCGQLEPGLDRRGLARVILITDGQTNCGIIDVESIVSGVEQVRHRRISTSTIGIGEGFNERLLSRMADAGGGHFYYVQHPRQLPPVVEREVREVSEVVCCEVSMHIEVPEGAAVQCLNGLPLEEDPACGARHKLLIGDLIAEQELRLVLEVKLPAGQRHSACSMSLEIADRDQRLGIEPTRIEWRWAAEVENNAQRRDQDVTRATAKLFAARARQRAVELNEAGSYDAAARLLLSTARTNRRVAAGDRVQLKWVKELERDAALLREPLNPEDTKTMFTAGYLALRGREDLGALLNLHGFGAPSK